jgi:uncharacterized protein (TIGR01777 family)
MNIYEKEIELDFPVEDVFKFHERDGALKRLSPPWQKIRVIKHVGGILPGADVKLELYDPFKIIWKAKHLEYNKNSFFSDIQTMGPFSKWKHNHIFEKKSDDSSLMTDKIEFKLPFNSFIHPANRLVYKKLEQIFSYRHKILQRDLYINSIYNDKKTILLSGGSGVLGNILVPKLLTAGHDVRFLVRRLPRSKNEFYWNPGKGIIDKKAFKDVDVVINLSGEPIGEDNWTKIKKKRILESRINTASILSKTISKLKNPPNLFISSSATGFYGDTKDEIIDEESRCGDLFISDVCKKWEDAAIKNLKAETRLVILRTGVVLTPEGGALPVLLRGFYTGTSAVPGSGKQFVSWISSEDWINMVNEIIFNDEISGIVNGCAPNPVNFEELIKDISKAIKLPAYFRVHENLIKLFTGQRGYETVICGSRVLPKKMLENNFKFFHESPFESIKEMLGRK